MPNTFVSIESDYSEFTGTRTIYHQCDRVQIVRYPNGETEKIRCGANSFYLVTQVGELTGNQFTLHLCENHAKPYIEAEKLK